MLFEEGSNVVARFGSLMLGWFVVNVIVINNFFSRPLGPRVSDTRRTPLETSPDNVVIILGRCLGSNETSEDSRLEHSVYSNCL